MSRQCGLEDNALATTNNANSPPFAGWRSFEDTTINPLGLANLWKSSASQAVWGRQCDFPLVAYLYFGLRFIGRHTYLSEMHLTMDAWKWGKLVEIMSLSRARQQPWLKRQSWHCWFYLCIGRHLSSVTAIKHEMLKRLPPLHHLTYLKIKV